MNKQKICTFYIIRHGETEGNATGILGLDPRLTANGIKQAEGLALQLRNIHFDAVFSSDLIRAKQTAEIILLERDLILQTTKAIREKHFGVMEGKHEDVYKQKIKNLLDELETMTAGKRSKYRLAEGMENDEELVSRFGTFLREAAIAYSDKTALVVCHGSLMRIFLIHLGFGSFQELPAGSVQNTGYFVLESDGIDFFVKETSGIHKKEI